MIEQMRTLTVKQPWATLIAEGVKDVENRTWHTKYRGPLAIHAGMAYDDAAHQFPAAAHAFLHDDRIRKLRVPDLPRGAIVAVVELVSCHSWRDCRQDNGNLCSEWAEVGTTHWTLELVGKLPEPMPWTGSLGLRLLSSETASLVGKALVG